MLRARHRRSIVVVLLASACTRGLLGTTEGADDGDATDDDDGDDDRGDDDRGDGDDDRGDDDDDDRGDDDDDDRGDDDDGEVDSGMGDEAGDDTGTAPSCGDGVLDERELCDDGNDGSGDGCDADCRPTPGFMRWSQTFDGANEDDAARDVVITPADEIVVVGAMELMGTDTVWAHSFTVDGESVVDGILDYGDDGRATSVTLTDDAQVYVVGVLPDQDRALLMRFEDGLVDVAGAPTDVASFSALASATAEGFAVVTHTGGFDSLAASIRRFDSAANALGDVGMPVGTLVGAAIPADDGGTIVGGMIFGGPGSDSSAWVGAYDAGGAPRFDSVLLDDPGVELRIRGLAYAGDGRIVGVGTRGTGGPMDQGDEGWIWWLSPGGVLESSGPLDIGGAAARPNAVVVGANGLVVGGTTIGLDDGFVAGFALDGELLWGHEIAGDLGLEDGVVSLAWRAGTGVAAAGWVTQSGTGEDAWVGLFNE